MDVSAVAIRAANLTLTKQNLGLRQQIASLRNDHFDLQHELVKTIGAKESFKIEVIKLITQAQNTFERLKTFIEHTTSTPPRPLLLSGKLLRRQIVDGNQYQQQKQQKHWQRGILRQIPIMKDGAQQHLEPPPPPPPPPPSASSTSAQDENYDMHFIDEKIRKLNTILKKYKGDVKNQTEKENENENEKEKEKEQKVRRTTESVALKQPATNVKGENKNRRYSKRLLSNVSSCSPSVEKQIEDNKKNSQLACAFKDITTNVTVDEMRLGEAQGGLGALAIPAAKKRGRKRKIIV